MAVISVICISLFLSYSRKTFNKWSVFFFFLAVAADPADSPLYLPYKALLSTVRSMVFSEGEAQQLIEILSDKTGIIQDTWHKVRPIS